MNMQRNFPYPKGDLDVGNEESIISTTDVGRSDIAVSPHEEGGEKLKCPFYKFDRFLYERCARKYSIKRFPDVKQHLIRQHLSSTQRSHRSISFLPCRKEYFVEGHVNGARVEALPDSGADVCFISPNLASSLGLYPATGTKKMINLATDRLVQSPGMVEVAWKFANSRKETILTCWIIPGCVHDLVLGSPFLRATETLTRLVDFPRRLRLRLLGEEKQRLWGFLNGRPTAALPDTGSDIMLISSEYARRHSLVVDRDFENWLEVEFADGTTDWTNGVVRNVEWNVGGKTVQCDFHVLDGLSVDVVLNNDYLFDSNMFWDYAEWFSDTNAAEDVFHLRNIRLIGRYGDTFNALEEDYLEDSRGCLRNTKNLTNHLHSNFA
ncbi:unnamed protein product [Clonostachys rosea]|uniref:Peptidase A2 domain-containing protein n=1 Tax=Bionectria ochroleuca TaxID=29856 RepID=A0ABY6UIY8_BIOOC|nr:unnamed protein product [Clonostachys rosea]